MKVMLTAGQVWGEGVGSYLSEILIKKVHDTPSTSTGFSVTSSFSSVWFTVDTHLETRICIDELSFIYLVVSDRLQSPVETVDTYLV